MAMDIDRQLDDHFEQQSGFYDNIYRGHKIEIPKDAFELRDGERVVGCMDEGVADAIHIGSPGSFVLDGEEHAVKMLATKGVGKITSHSGCAAAKVALIQKGITSPTPQQVDEYAQEFAMNLARKLGVQHEHIPLKRPAGFHIARGAIYDGSRGANIFRENGIIVGQERLVPPPVFRINRKHIGDKVKAVTAVGIAAGIATGSKSFGERITPDSPFVIFALGHPTNPELSASRLVTELEHEKIGIGGHIGTLREHFGRDILRVVPLSAPPYRSRHQQSPHYAERDYGESPRDSL